jgi:reverse transcriptase-like protein
MPPPHGPLTRLLKKDSPFVFDDAACQAFRQLKTEFANAPVLAHRPSTLETEASKLAVAYVFSRPDANNIPRSVTSYLHMLSPAELNYVLLHLPALGARLLGGDLL